MRRRDYMSAYALDCNHLNAPTMILTLDLLVSFGRIHGGNAGRGVDCGRFERKPGLSLSNGDQIEEGDGVEGGGSGVTCLEGRVGMLASFSREQHWNSEASACSPGCRASKASCSHSNVRASQPNRRSRLRSAKHKLTEVAMIEEGCQKCAVSCAPCISHVQHAPSSVKSHPSPCLHGSQLVHCQPHNSGSSREVRPLNLALTVALDPLRCTLSMGTRDVR